MELSGPLRIASCMAPNADSMCRELAAYLGQRLGVPVVLVETNSWRERERRFDAGEIDLCWICGLPYVEKADSGLSIGLGVAPVMQDERYGRAPVYFSDVVVGVDSPYKRFADFRGKTWAFNEPKSHSGFNIVRHHLASLGHDLDFFGSLVEAGSHQAALRMVMTGEVAGAAIDSTVLEAEARSNPEVLEKTRSVAILGPSPAPPWVFSPKVPHHTRENVTRCLARMHQDDRGAAVLDIWGIQELRVVTDDFYNPIRRMMRATTRLQS